MIIVKLNGIDDANAAELVRNYDLCIEADKLAKLPPDFYYQHDIVGLHVATLNGREVGTIVDIMITGSNDVYVMKALSGRQILLPAIKEVIKQIDLIRKVMYIDPMQGLLDDDVVIADQDDLSEEEEE